MGGCTAPADRVVRTGRRVGSDRLLGLPGRVPGGSGLTGRDRRRWPPLDHRILVVDDEPSITDLVTMALHLQGATVEVAHTGTDALRAVQAFRPHLVVLDVMLPDLDGFEVLERMGHERQSADIPVLFLTAAATSTTGCGAWPWAATTT